MRTVIIGGPNTGKTTLARKMMMIEGAEKVLHTDDLIHLEWSEASNQASEWFDAEFDVIEGVTAVRALRKWLQRNPQGKPCDRVVYLDRFHESPTKAQLAMTKGISKVFLEIRNDLLARGVEIELRS